MDDAVGDVRTIRHSTGLDILAWRDLGGGFTKNLALQTAQSVVVARIHSQTTSLERVRAEQMARAALAVAGVPAVVATDLTLLPDGRVLELEPFVNATEKMKTPSTLTTGAWVLGRLHDVLAAGGFPDEARSVRWSHHAPAERVIATAQALTELAQVSDDVPVSLAAALLDHAQHLSDLEEPLLSHRVVQLTHGDYWDDNVLFRRNAVAAVLDFGFLAARARVDDLALPFWFWLLEPDHGPLGAQDDALLASLVAAYDDSTHRPLNRYERRALPLAVARQPFWTAELCLLDPARARRHVRRLKRELPVAHQAITRWT